MASYAQNAVSGKMKRFSTRVEKADQTEINKLVEDGDIPEHLAFIA